MKGKPKKSPRKKDITSRFTSGELDDDDQRLDINQRFSNKSKNLQRDKTLKTSIMRAGELNDPADIQSLPIGQVTLVYSRYCEVESGGSTWLCQVRKTLTKVSGADIVVGDFVRFRVTDTKDESGRPEASIEQMLPRKTLLTRADSFKQIVSHPVVANAEQMLIVVSLHEPNVKWGLIDRMIIAAQAGGLEPIVCLNKIDLRRADEDDEWGFAELALRHYQSIGVRTLHASVIQNVGIESIRELLRGRVTVLAGHSGVGKSSLIRAVQSDLDLRVGEISNYTGKGRHTTTSARRYNLAIGGQVIDTPGVKLFGLWGLTRDNLIDHFPDVTDGTAPPWRQDSYQRIEASL